MTMVPTQEKRWEGCTAIECDRCGKTLQIPRKFKHSPRDYMHDHCGWGTLWEDQLSQLADYCPDHLMSHSGLRRDIQVWETQYLVGDVFDVFEEADGIQLVPKDDRWSVAYVRQFLRRTKHQNWQLFPERDDGFYFEQSFDGLGLYPTRRKSSPISKRLRQLHLWAGGMYPELPLVYEDGYVFFGDVRPYEMVRILNMLRLPVSKGMFFIDGTPVDLTSEAFQSLTNELNYGCGLSLRVPRDVFDALMWKGCDFD